MNEDIKALFFEYNDGGQKVYHLGPRIVAHIDYSSFYHDMHSYDINYSSPFKLMTGNIAIDAIVICIYEGMEMFNMLDRK